jgi:hypothetical protein
VGYTACMPLVAGPVIARLFARPRLWAYKRIKRGRFGPVVKRRGRALLVDLAAVEAAAGTTFTPAQLAAAGVPVTVTITKPEED